MNLEFSFTTARDYHTIIFRGDMTVISSAPVSMELSKKIAAESKKDYVLDLSGVKSIDSSGLRFIITLKEKIEEHNGQLSILKPSKTVMKILRETNMIKVLDIIKSYDTLKKQ